MSFEIVIRHRVGMRPIALDARSEARIVAIIGSSGMGKTTALNCIAGLTEPEQGRIAVDDVILFDRERGIDLAPEQRRAGYVFQDNRLFPHLRVGANLAYGERLNNPTERWISREEVLDFLGIGHLVHRWPANLSDGETRRVAIGRALLSAPRFLLLDEPLTSLDAARREDILRVIERIRDDLAIPMVLVSHSREEIDRLTGAVIELS